MSRPTEHVSHSSESSSTGTGSSDSTPISDDERDRLWLSILLGTDILDIRICVRYKTPAESTVRAGLLWNPELRVALEKLAWELLPELLQQSAPAWMQTIKLEK